MISYQLIDRKYGKVYDVFISSLGLKKIKSLEKQIGIEHGVLYGSKIAVFFDLIKKEDSTFKILEIGKVKI